MAIQRHGNKFRARVEPNLKWYEFLKFKIAYILQPTRKVLDKYTDSH